MGFCCLLGWLQADTWLSYWDSLASAGWLLQPTYLMLQKFPTNRESGNVWFSRKGGTLGSYEEN